MYDTILDYDHKFDSHDRERCEVCGAWVPWPALDDHVHEAGAR